MLFASGFEQAVGIVIIVIGFYLWLAARLVSKHPAAATKSLGFLWRLFK
jgi:hypothetical protein